MTNAVMPLCLGTSGSERAISSPHSENWAPELHTFWPLTHPLVAVADGTAAEVGEVGAGAGLGEQLAAQLAGGEERRHERGLLLVGARRP